MQEIAESLSGDNRVLLLSPAKRMRAEYVKVDELDEVEQIDESDKADETDQR